ncbi:MAG: glycosyltransferase family 4 protein [Sporolactobacillus sp.]|jgi:glycosyltransferase involved in cell wall biosynthesis|nr:glycosyltransferase family 4 protein [Sporolactobacillus sp.]
MGKKKLYILHQNGAPRHFESVFFLNNELNSYNEIVQVEFSIFRQLIKGLLKLNWKKIKKTFINIGYLLYFLFTKNKDIIIGAAPYDIFIVYMLIIKKKHNIIYYTSWPYWDLSRYPERIYFNFQVKMWEKFLDGTKVVAVTESVKRGLHKYSDKIKVIPHCVNPLIFKNNNKEKHNGFRVLFVGRLIELKGIQIIVDLINKDKSSLFQWWFVGNGELSNEIKRLSEKKDNVKYFGKITDQSKLCKIYNQCDVLLLLSIPSFKWEELFGIVIIEAMICGVVPIASNCIGPLSIIDNDVNGFIVSSNYKNKVQAILINLLNDKNKLMEMKINAIKDAQEKYSIQVTSKKWAEVLNI